MMFRVLTIMFLAASAALAEPADVLDKDLQRAMHVFEVPGAAVVIVEGDRVVYQRALGELRRGGSEPVDAHTLFAIGSITKSFTAAATGVLVDEGRLDWDDPVIKFLPGFRMYDDYATQHLTIRDILAHRSGLASGAGDLLSWPETHIATTEAIRRLRFIKPRRGFRARYGYSNLLYQVAGQVIAEVSGTTWEDFVRSRIIDPLDMRDAVLSGEELQEKNAAWPHARLGGVLRGLGSVTPLPRRYASDGAAGAILASSADMAKWIAVQLGNGEASDGTTIFSEEVARAMHAPQTILRIRNPKGPFAVTTPSFWTYGLGWFVQDYRGAKVVTHAGGTLGAVALLTMLPKENVGFAILTNSEEGGFLKSLELRILDRYLEVPSTDWISLQAQMEASDRAEVMSEYKATLEALPRGESPSLPLADYAGRYRDAWFGTVTIDSGASGLYISFDRSPYLRGALEHVGGNVFLTDFDEPGMENALVTFSVRHGRITNARLRAISPMADFSFDYKDLLLEPEDTL